MAEPLREPVPRLVGVSSLVEQVRVYLERRRRVRVAELAGDADRVELPAGVNNCARLERAPSVRSEQV